MNNAENTIHDTNIDKNERSFFLRMVMSSAAPAMSYLLSRYKLKLTKL